MTEIQEEFRNADPLVTSTYKKNGICPCGALYKKGDFYVKLRKVKLCRICLETAAITISNGKFWQRDRNNTWLTIVRGENYHELVYCKSSHTLIPKVFYCKWCHKLIENTEFHAQTKPHQTCTNRYCLSCVKEMSKSLLVSLIPLTHAELDRILLEIRFGKETMKMIKK